MQCRSIQVVGRLSRSVPARLRSVVPHRTAARGAPGRQRLDRGEFAAYSLVNAEGQITPTRISSLLGIPPTTVSYLVRQMTARGHVRRLPNPDDGRSALVELTPAGRRVTQQATRDSRHRGVSEHLSIPEANVLSSLEAMAGVLEQAIESTAAVALVGELGQSATAGVGVPSSVRPWSSTRWSAGGRGCLGSSIALSMAASATNPATRKARS